jgi:uncharacterized protein (TIGR02266 family)
MLAKLDEGMHEEAVVVAWIEALKLGSGVVDLVYDLRTLADLHHEHTGPLAKRSLTSAGLVSSARSTADAVEYALREGEGVEAARQRNAIARAWTLFAPGYERAAATGRRLTREAGAEKKFPPLGLVASYKRGRRRAVSLVPVAPKPSPAGDAPNVIRSDPPPGVPPAPASSSKILSALTGGDRKSGPESRLQVRHAVELEMGFASDSNFYVGFTENLSVSGVFVATYAAKPIGSRIGVSLTLPSGETIKTNGVVRWQRAPSEAGWPGMGVQFDGISPEDEAKIRTFLSLREPLFYDV